MNTDRRLLAAFDAVSAACGVARAVQRDLQRVQRITKDDKSPVTVADFAVQAVVAMKLEQALAGDSQQLLLVGEEHTEALRTPEQKPVLDAVLEAVRGVSAQASSDDVLRAIDLCDHDATADAYWTLDPVDGTKGFLRGQQYAIALALIEDGEVTLGVMGCPNLPLDSSASLEVADANGCIYSAVLSRGAFEHRVGAATPLRSIESNAFDGSHGIRVCESVEAAHSKHDDVARVIEACGGAGHGARLDSQCKYAVVARGQSDAYLRMPTKKGYVEKIWDHAAGMLIAQEAGAIVSDITGAPLDFTHGRTLAGNRGIVCACAGLHERLIDAIARLGIGAPV